MSSAHSSRMPSLETSVSPLPSSSITETPSATQSKHDEQTTPTPESPSTSVSRKRPAVQFDLTTEEEKRYTPRPGRHQSRTDSYDSSVEPCNCPPEAKIPRPRNAFILYRQHHQAGIVAKYPSMTNPDISKIIGEQWNKAPFEVKQEWKKLAEEEAIRHQRQHPGYRYQPRRSGSTRKSSIAESPVDPPSHCRKCGGLSNDPQTPTPSSVSQRMLTPTSLQPDGRHHTSNTNFASPSNRMIRPAVPTQLPLASGSANRKIEHTPEPKRRRLTNGTYGPPHVATPIVTAYPTSAPHFRDSFGCADPSAMRYMQQPSSHLMGPPPRPYQPPAQLRGPVLTPVTTNNAPSQRPPPVPPVRPQSPNFMTKLTLLNRISPAYSFPKRAKSSDDIAVSPSPRKRGAIVSVEGDDAEAVTQAVNWLGEFLCRADEYTVRTASGPRVIAPDETVTLTDYLDLIRDWHDKSKEMIDFVTRRAIPTTETSDHVPHHTNNIQNDTLNGAEPKTTATTPPPPTLSSDMPIPLILLRRYQLHASNTFAHHIPLGPTYTPIDHWQWMATLWRGTVGPDLTVYIRDYDDPVVDNMNGAGSPTISSNGHEPVVGPGSRTWGEVAGRNKGVEVMQDRNLVVVWKRKGGVLEEAALRRVAFEVGEGARGIWEGRT